MSTIPEALRYTKDDEWAQKDGDEVVVGITDHAQDALSDIVYLELPNVGDFFGINETFGVVESVKAAADLYMPMSGTITAVNEALIDAPEMINSSPYEAWMVRLEPSEPEQWDALMDADAYAADLEARE